MAEILLAHCNHLYFDRKQVRKMEPYPPLQTLIAAALLRREGFDVALFDATLNAPEDGFREALKLHRPRLVALCEDNFNFLTKMCLTRNRELAFSMARVSQEARIPVVVNSSDATDHALEYLRRGITCVMIGEVEYTLIETAGRLLRGKNPALHEVRGLAYLDRGAGEVRLSARRELIQDLDHLPSPAWDLVEIADYRE